MKKIILPIALTFLLQGCLESSLIVGPAIGGAQGRVVQSSLSSVASYGIKAKTGKYPIQHIIQLQKQKVVNTASLIEGEVQKSISNAKKIIKGNKKEDTFIKSPENVQASMVSYEGIKNKIQEFNIVKVSKKTFNNMPRFSYKSK